MVEKRRNNRRWVSTKRITDILTGEVLVDEGYWYEGPWALAHGDPNLDQNGWAFYEAGTEAGSTEISEDTTESLTTDTTYLCRIVINETAGNAANNAVFTWEYQNTTQATGWTAITTTSSHIRAVSGNLTNGGDTTNRHSGGTGTFTGGEGQTTDGTSGGNTCDIAASGHTEQVLEFQVRSADVADGDSIEIRVTSSTDPNGMTYTNVASLTASEPVTKSLSYTGTGSATLTKQVNKDLSGHTGTGTFVNYIRPRVWLNSTQTKTGADEMTVTAYNTAGTSITFTDPSGGQTGSLQLGVENLKNGGIAWSAVTVNAGGVTQKNLSYTGTGSVTLTKQVNKDTFDHSGVGTSSVQKDVTKGTFSSAGTGTSTVLKQINLDTFANTGTGSVTLLKGVQKGTFSTSGVGTTDLTKAVSITRAMSGVATVTVTKQVGKVTFATTGTGTVSFFEAQKTKLVALTSFVGTGTATIVKQAQKTLSSSGVGTVTTFSKALQLAKTLTFGGVGTPTVQKQIEPVTKPTTGTGTASLTQLKTKLRNYSYSGVGTATMTKQVQYARSFSHSGVGTASPQKAITKDTFSVGAVGTPAFNKNLQATLSFSFSGVGTPSETIVGTDIVIEPSMTGTGTVSTFQRAVAKTLSFVGIGLPSQTNDGTPEEEQWMDGSMTEEEWWTRRRRLYRRMRGWSR